jgi:hypothetical protein
MSAPGFTTSLRWITTALPTEHDGTGHVYLVDETGRKVASVWGPKELKVLNANLWAAAPDLLAIVQRLVSADIAADIVASPASKQLLQDGRAAVAKAEGRQ